MRKPELGDICKSVVDAWKELNAAIIVKGFKKCCISNKVDGTEDDILYKEFIKERRLTEAPQETNDDDKDLTDNNYYTDMYYTVTEKEFDQF